MKRLLLFALAIVAAHAQNVQPRQIKLTSNHIIVGSSSQGADVAMSGDVTITSSGATTVIKVNGASVPASAAVLGSNSSSQAIAAPLTSAHLYVGNGSNLPVDVAASGDLTLANTGAFTIGNNVVNSAKSAVVNTRRTACIVIGANNAAAAIVDADLGPQSRQFFVNAASTVVEIEVAADAGTPNIIIGKSHAGSISNLTSSALATASSGGIACSNTGGTTGIDGATTCSSTLQNTSVAAGDWITLVSGTAGGTAKEMTACVTMTVN